MVEQGTHKPLVVSSTLTLATNHKTPVIGVFVSLSMIWPGYGHTPQRVVSMGTDPGSG